MLLAPSILSADFARLGEQIRAVESGGAALIHCDVMDGHFVPNLSFGPPLLRAVQRVATVPLDVHLMIEGPERSLATYREAGAEWITVHAEACSHLHRTLARIRALGARPGVALNPASPLALVEEVLADIDLLLVMSVDPGFGGQSFIDRSLDKIVRAKELRARHQASFQIQVDGGVDATNVAEVVEAGADIVVAGSALFDDSDPAAAARRVIGGANR